MRFEAIRFGLVMAKASDEHRCVRIVSLCPSLTELAFDLGRGADLVGGT
jgi:ABC-type hemin transport system substrate-binding protein